MKIFFLNICLKKIKQFLFYILCFVSIIFFDECFCFDISVSEYSNNNVCDNIDLRKHKYIFKIIAEGPFSFPFIVLKIYYYMFDEILKSLRVLLNSV